MGFDQVSGLTHATKRAQRGKHDLFFSEAQGGSLLASSALGFSRREQSAAGHGVPFGEGFLLGGPLIKVVAGSGGDTSIFGCLPPAPLYEDSWRTAYAGMDKESFEAANATAGTVAHDARVGASKAPDQSGSISLRLGCHK